MDFDGIPDAEPQEPAKRIHRRAAHACARCRTRKVRCDVAIRGSPCMNCDLDGDDCEVTMSRRAKRHWRSQTRGFRKLTGGLHTTQAASGELNTSDGQSEIQGPGNGGKLNYNYDAHNETTTAKEAAATVGLAAGSSQEPKLPTASCLSTETGIDGLYKSQPPACSGDYTQATATAFTELRQPEARSGLRVNDKDIIGTLLPTLPGSSDNSGLWIAGDTGFLATKDMLPLACYIGYSYYGFLVISNLEAIPQQDFQFLELQGCLHVPNRPILDTFMCHYFKHMHPMLPILDEGVFWDIYAQRPLAKQPDAKASLLLFQAMLFACCSVSYKGNSYALSKPGEVSLADTMAQFVPQKTLQMLGLSTTRDARAAFYRRSKLLFDLETETSLIHKSQAALLLASWSFSSYEVPRKPAIPWLTIAIQYAKDAEAHNYDAFEVESEQRAVRKRLWWGCVIRDRLFSLGMRRGIHITTAQFDPRGNSPLGYFDLLGELHQSMVYGFETKASLAEIMASLVELCIILTDILGLAFPIEEALKRRNSSAETLLLIQKAQKALNRWHNETNERLPNFDAPSREHKDHDSVVLFTNLVNMYYYSAKAALGHYEILQLATIAMTAQGASPLDSLPLREDHFELQDAALGTTGCLETLIRLGLVRCLPITAVSCTALPLLLHVLEAQMPTAMRNHNPRHTGLVKHRLKILEEAMETYKCQYEGVDWIMGAIGRVVNLARAGSIASADSMGIWQTRHGETSVDGLTGTLAFQPGWYLRLAFTIDVAFSKGRLPEDQSFLRSFRDLVTVEMSSGKDGSGTRRPATPAKKSRPTPQSRQETGAPEDGVLAMGNELTDKADSTAQERPTDEQPPWFVADDNAEWADLLLRPERNEMSGEGCPRACSTTGFSIEEPAVDLRCPKNVLPYKPEDIGSWFGAGKEWPSSNALDAEFAWH